MNYVVQKYHWENSKKFESDFIYLDGLYERVLIALSSKLNEIHNVNYSKRYWRIFLGQWAYRFTHTLFDRWQSIEELFNEHLISGMIALSIQGESLVPRDLVEFEEFRSSDVWNHFIYLEILNNKKFNPTINVRYEKKIFLQNNGSKKNSFFSKCLDAYNNLAKLLMKSRDALLFDTYLTKFEFIKLNLKLMQIPIFFRHTKCDNFEYDNTRRTLSINISPENNFEEFLSRMLIKHIPKIYIEGFSRSCEKIEKIGWPSEPKLICTAIGLGYDPYFMLYTAINVEMGSILYYMQHGGVYGVDKFVANEKHEIVVSDKYFTWGWKNDSSNKIVPLGINKINHALVGGFNKKSKLVIVFANGSRYASGGSGQPAINYDNYMKNIALFIESLDSKIINHLILRTHPWDLGFSPALRLKEIFPNLAIDAGVEKISVLYRKARVVIHTYNQTGFLETIALNIPTILICDLTIVPIRDSAIPIYNELKRVGVLFDNAYLAGAHIDSIWDNVESWWQNEELQIVLSKFKKEYCHIENNISSRIVSAFRNESRRF